jgi:molybdopterin/thiamine biosynthesis adenylyltransferase
VVRFVSALREVKAHIDLIDGDEFEERNRERMDVPEFGNKAAVIAEGLLDMYRRPGLVLRGVERYLDESNVMEWLGEGDIVLLCVDNHATRKIVADRCASLDDVLLISGGNDGVEGEERGTYGNVQVYRRDGGVERNPPLDRFHPEIADPAEHVPGPSCVDLAATAAPQIGFTNLMAAAAVGAAFYRELLVDSPAARYDESCFDVEEALWRPLRFGGSTAASSR